MPSVSELPNPIRDALCAEMGAGERVLLVTRPSPRHAWGDGEVGMAESLRARALVGALRIALAGPVALQLLMLLLNAPVLILHDSGFTLGAVAAIVVAVAILGVMFAMALYVAGAPVLWMWHAARCTFVVTSGAAYVIRDRGDHAIVRRTALPTPQAISVLRLRPSGIGDVVFDSGSVFLPGGEGSEDRTVEYDVGLLSVPGAERVAATLRDAAQSARSATRSESM